MVSVKNDSYVLSEFESLWWMSLWGEGVYTAVTAPENHCSLKWNNVLIRVYALSAKQCMLWTHLNSDEWVSR